MSVIATHPEFRSFTMLASAKINLFLHITGRRDNGYHEIESLFVRTDFGDKVTVESADDITLNVTGPFSKGLSNLRFNSNIVLQAAKNLQKCMNIGSGAKITLTKNLPVASGVGGGSADAATTLLALIKLWNVTIPNKGKLALALDLGADVPACLSDKPQWVSGIGEICKEVKLGREMAVLLVNPLVGISTADVFGAYRASGASFSSLIVEKSAVLSSNEKLKLLTSNDLHPLAQELAPSINDVITEMLGLPYNKLVRMSGSGATCFALFNSLSDALIAEEVMRNLKPEWWVASGHIRS